MQTLVSQVCRKEVAPVVHTRFPPGPNPRRKERGRLGFSLMVSLRPVRIQLVGEIFTAASPRYLERRDRIFLL